MAYRHAEPADLCAICSGKTERSCRHCAAPHCEAHLSRDACAGCAGMIWSLERRFRNRVAVGYGLVAVPAGALALMATFSGSIAFLGGLALVLLPLGLFGTARIARRLSARRFAHIALPPTSKPAKLPAPGATAEAGGPSNKAEKWWPSRGLRRPPGASAVQPRVVGRGLVFDKTRKRGS